MESNYSIPSNMMVKKLKRKLAKCNNSILRMKCFVAILLILSCTFIGLYILQSHDMRTLQANLNESITQHEELTEAYTSLYTEYSQLNTQLNDLKTQLNLSASTEVEIEPQVEIKTTEVEVVEPQIIDRTMPKEMDVEVVSESDNIILTDTLVEYQDLNSPNEVPIGFVYNPDIPLSEDLQKYAYSKCKESGIDYLVFLGLMRKESQFNPNAVSASNDHGLCQINICNHNWMREVFGSDWDPMNPYDNIDASLYILSSCAESYNCENYHILLMNYNMGHGNAVQCFNSGIYSSTYSRTVMKYAAEYGYSGDGSINNY